MKSIVKFSGLKLTKEEMIQLNGSGGGGAGTGGSAPGS